MTSWRRLDGFDLPYEVSDDGRVRRQDTARELKLSLTKEGYHRVGLMRGGKQRHHFVHRLVALSFIGPAPSGKPTVNHRDGDKRGNRPDNLEWATHGENYRHALNVLGFKPPRGLAHWNARRSVEEIAEIKRRLAAGEGVTAIARTMGVAISNVSLIRQGRLWAHV